MNFHENNPSASQARHLQGGFKESFDTQKHPYMMAKLSFRFPLHKGALKVVHDQNGCFFVRILTKKPPLCRREGGTARRDGGIVFRSWWRKNKMFILLNIDLFYFYN